MPVAVAEESETLMAFNEKNPSVGDGNLNVTFHKFAEYQKRESEGWQEWHPDGKATIHHGAGRKIFKDEDYIRIVSPGDRGNVVDRRVMNEDRIRFAKEWKAYSEGRSQDGARGTPLAILCKVVPPILTLSQVEELRYFNISTVEQLANAPDGNAPVPSFQSIKQAAQRFVRARSEDAPLESVKAELESRDADIASLKAQVAELLAARGARSPVLAHEAEHNPFPSAVTPDEEAPAPAPRKRGRPPKVRDSAAQ